MDLTFKDRNLNAKRSSVVDSRIKLKNASGWVGSSLFLAGNGMGDGNHYGDGLGGEGLENHYYKKYSYCSHVGFLYKDIDLMCGMTWITFFSGNIELKLWE